MIEAKLVDLLLADSGVAAIVGTRVDPVVVRQTTTLPSLTYRRQAGGDRTYSMAGRAGMTTISVALYGWATDYPTARSLADEIRQLLDGYTSNAADGIQVATVAELGDEWIDEIAAYGCGVQVTLMFLEV